MHSYKNKRPLDYYNELEKKEIEIYNNIYFNSKDIKDIDEINLNDIFIYYYLLTYFLIILYIKQFIQKVKFKTQNLSCRIT